jgi:hypothetical protein
MHRFPVRDIIEKESAAISFDVLIELLGEVTHSPEDVARTTFYYEDHEGDEIVVGNTRGLSNAVAAFANSGHASLKLTANGTQALGSQSGVGWQPYAVAAFANSGHASLKLTANGTKALGSQSGVGRQPCAVITDTTVTARLRSILADTSFDKVDYKDNFVSASKKATLVHLVDEFKDHITDRLAPPVQLTSTDYTWTYTINGKSEMSQYFAIDGIYLDLTVEPQEGRVKLLFPRAIYNNFSSVLNQQGNVSIEGVRDPREELQRVDACLDETNPPPFVWLKEHSGDDGHATGAFLLKLEGSLTDVMERDAHRHVYKVTGIFSASCIWKKTRNCAELTLVGLRVFSIHDNILKKDKVVNLTAFGK